LDLQEGVPVQGLEIGVAFATESNVLRKVVSIFPVPMTLAIPSIEKAVKCLRTDQPPKLCYFNYNEIAEGNKKQKINKTIVSYNPFFYSFVLKLLLLNIHYLKSK
jgi:hypothetical protein